MGNTYTKDFYLVLEENNFFKHLFYHLFIKSQGENLTNLIAYKTCHFYLNENKSIQLL